MPSLAEPIATGRPGPLTTLAAAVGAVTVIAATPGLMRFGPPCPFHSTTGLDCPGCGATRTIASLARGDVGAAFGHNVFVVASLPLLAAVWVCWLRASRGHPWPSWVRSPAPLVSWAALGIAFAVARNLPVHFLEPLRA